MSNVPAVVVKRGGFLSALASGFFGLLITCVICGSVVAICGMFMVSSTLDGVLRAAGQTMGAFPEAVENLPPTVAELFSDRRAPEYRDNVDVQLQIVGQSDAVRAEIAERGVTAGVESTSDGNSGRAIRADIGGQVVRQMRGHEGARAVLKVTNSGPDTITLMSLAVVIETADGVPVQDVRTYAATPLSFNVGDWRGPILPGSTRTFTCRLWNIPKDAAGRIEISDLRIATPRAHADPAPQARLSDEAPGSD